ncbi:MAG: radical SAM protein [Nitrospirae bacterium]|nr:radical SAM protein [Nitrospirota bacterium]
MKILLIFPKWTEDYGLISFFAKKASVWPPLNLCYLASQAESKGHVVKIIDGEAEDVPADKMVIKAEEFKPDLIGITATTPFFNVAVELAKRFKEKIKGCPPIIIGGPHITILKYEAFLPCFDYGFIGEADNSWNDFVKCLEEGSDFGSVKGILYRKDGNVLFSGIADSSIDVDSIPIPARHLLNLSKYNIGTMHGVKRFTTIMTSRGCPFNCIFCSTKVFGKRSRRRTPRLVVDEIAYIVKNFGITHFIFLDDTLTANRDHIMEICDLIKKDNLSITFEAGTRANLLDEELVAKMAGTGLTRISFGLESVDENIRKIMRKEVPIESYISSNKLTNKYNIETLNSCMIGLPGETIETIEKTLKFLRHSKEIKQANLSIAIPYPGTQLYEMAKKGEYGLKLLIDDFSKFRRYGSAVMQVGDFTPEDMIRIQNDAFVSIYLAYWRIIPMIRKSGILGGLLTLGRLLRAIPRIFAKSSEKNISILRIWKSK